MAPISKLIFFTMHRFVGINSHQQKLLVEASLYLLAARLMVSLMPFRNLSRILDKKLEGMAVGETDGVAVVDDISWAVNRAARHLPVRLVCFPQGIAAFLMLRRRRIDSRLYYGISNVPGKNFVGHVWVMYGKKSVTGCEQAHEYTVMMSYPSEQ